MKRKLLLLIACTLLAATSFAQTSGSCGPNLTWTLDESTGTLIISGTGEMTSSPWPSSITNVIIEEGVTSIGSDAFYYCTSLTSITIPNSVTSIGDGAFFNSGLISVTIGNSVTNIGDYAFAGCSELKEITVEWQTPLEKLSYVFSGVDVSNVKLIVPAGTADLYRAAPVWQDFMIEESTGIETSTANDPVVDTLYFDLNGQEITQPQAGQVYIAKELRQSGKTTVRKVVVND